MYTSNDLGAWFKNERKPGLYGGFWIDEYGNLSELIPVKIMDKFKVETSKDIYFSDDVFIHKSGSNSWIL
jgi:hypothetical protein